MKSGRRTFRCGNRQWTGVYYSPGRITPGSEREEKKRTSKWTFSRSWENVVEFFDFKRNDAKTRETRIWEKFKLKSGNIFAKLFRFIHSVLPSFFSRVCSAPLKPNLMTSFCSRVRIFSSFFAANWCQRSSQSTCCNFVAFLLILFRSRVSWSAVSSLGLHSGSSTKFMECHRNDPFRCDA